MIARSLLLYLLLIVLPDVYIDYRFLRRSRWWRRLLWWLPALVMVVYTVKLAMEPNFVPDRPSDLHLYLFLLGLLVVPKAVFVLFSLAGRLLMMLCRVRRNYGNLLGLLAVPLLWFILCWGSFVGFGRLEVSHVELSFPDLPSAFDGYRIVQFSDAHVGTYTGFRQPILQRAVDSINAQHADLIVFTGDLQNISPADIYPHRDLLASLRARDGVFSVLGNHDYADYVDCLPATKVANCRETVSLERQMGWTLLLNDHRKVSRGGQHIVIAGMENDGEGRFPSHADVAKTMQGVAPSDFVVMLEHDPSSWRRTILPATHAQLTLSGHTHAGQITLFGWSPVALVTPEWNGLYREGARALFVSAGLGGVIPLRFGATGQVVVVTMRKNEKMKK